MNLGYCSISSVIRKCGNPRQRSHLTAFRSVNCFNNTVYLESTFGLTRCREVGVQNNMDKVGNFTEGEFYQVNFDSRAYIETFYSNPGGHKDENYLSFVLQRLSDTFASGELRLPGLHL